MVGEPSIEGIFIGIIVVVVTNIVVVVDDDDVVVVVVFVVIVVVAVVIVVVVFVVVVDALFATICFQRLHPSGGKCPDHNRSKPHEATFKIIFRNGMRKAGISFLSRKYQDNIR